MVGLLRRAAIEKIGAAASSIYYGLENKSFASLVAQGVVFINMAKKWGVLKGRAACYGKKGQIRGRVKILCTFS